MLSEEGPVHKQCVRAQLVEKELQDVPAAGACTVQLGCLPPEAGMLYPSDTVQDLRKCSSLGSVSRLFSLIHKWLLGDDLLLI